MLIVILAIGRAVLTVQLLCVYPVLIHVAILSIVTVSNFLIVEEILERSVAVAMFCVLILVTTVVMSSFVVEDSAWIIAPQVHACCVAMEN